MSFLDYAVLALVALAAGFAVGRIARKRRHGGCVGCSACLGNCAACERKSTQEKRADGGVRPKE